MALIALMACGLVAAAVASGAGADTRATGGPAGGRKGESAAAAAANRGEEFFIVSSLDAARGRIVLKRPTEVTVVMRVSEQTVYRGEDGQPLRYADLRAGETAYITFTRDPAGGLAAILVRLGPMTVAELHQRYLGPHHP